ncbi:hypothetical protein NDU88_002372 [Pleurodeles waltl]|uniref:Uncharacterized protein n=1 Tax=Pleurodeles waltl TaxID=8319 RepID=A0AAV7UWU4_PLEWA|nr:hypothetical protein NDU88_002372 [Pleurodeles waltl]
MASQSPRPKHARTPLAEMRLELAAASALALLGGMRPRGGASETARETLTPYLEMLTEAYELGRLPESQREAKIVVLHKKGCDPLDVRSYRLLSLLNSDCKLLGKVLANRLLPLMPILVHPDQSGCMHA